MYKDKGLTMEGGLGLNLGEEGRSERSGKMMRM